MMQGKLKVKGDLVKIVRYARAANELVHLTEQVDTQLPRRGLSAVRAVVFDGRRSGPRRRRARPGDRRSPATRSCASPCAAICGSDLHFLHGKAPVEPGEGLGHEAVGVVEAVGGGVARFRPGDRVVVAFNIACGACWFCREGQTQLCERLPQPRGRGVRRFAARARRPNASASRRPT